MEKSKYRIKFDNHPNPFHLKWKTVSDRMRLKNQTFEEAMSFPAQPQITSDRIAFENHENPYYLKWPTIRARLNNGESLEKSMSYPSRPQTTSNRLAFDSHPNPLDLKWYTVKARIRNGESFEEAISYPSGRGKIDIFRKGFVMFEGSWASLDDLNMIYNKDTTENMLKTGVEEEKLFKRKE